MEYEYGSPMKGFALRLLQAFLEKMSLQYDDSIEFTVNLTEDAAIIATGSLDHNVLKCIAVDPAFQGEDLTATLLTELQREAFSRGLSHLFLFTKPNNQAMFEPMGFSRVAATSEMLLMENRRNGIADFVRSLASPQTDGVIGSVVANCNPFTNGHRYLIETASQQCDFLHVFILSEDRSEIPADERMRLAAAGTRDLPNVLVHPTSDYLISSATFPTYFLKERENLPAVQCRLDLEVFVTWFARELHITKRFVGTEPFCQVTACYNREMKSYLPPRGIEVVEIPRRTLGELPISASDVRRLARSGDWDAVAELVPAETLSSLKTRTARSNDE